MGIFKNPNLSALGFTLTELMISLAVSSILMLGAASVFIYTEQSKQSAIAMADTISLKSYLQQYFSNPTTCASLLGVSLGPPPTSSLIIDPTVMGPATTLLTIYQSDGTTPMFINNPTGSTNRYGHLQITRIEFINNTGAISTKSLMSGLGNRYASGNLQLTYTDSSRLTSSTTARVMLIPLTVLVDPSNTAIGCSSINPDDQMPTLLPTCVPGQVLIFDLNGTQQWMCVAAPAGGS
jgi:prepilin-type N-terminal cleavage/methylation domain-containing protein